MPSLLSIYFISFYSNFLQFFGDQACQTMLCCAQKNQCEITRMISCWNMPQQNHVQGGKMAAAQDTPPEMCACTM